MPKVLPNPNQSIDVSSDVCPMTFVRTRLALDKLHPGHILEVLLQGEEPRRQVPLSAIEHGYTVLLQEGLENGKIRLLIQKPLP